MRAYEQNGEPFRITSKWNLGLANEVVDAAHGRGGPGHLIQTEEDWLVVDRITTIYAKYFPREVKEFLKINQVIRGHQDDKFGRLRDNTTSKGGDAQIRQLGQWPLELEKLLSVVWPDQKFNKPFLRKFFARFPAFATAEKI